MIDFTAGLATETRSADQLHLVATACNSHLRTETFYSVSGLSCPEADAYLTVIFNSFLHNNNINSDYILGEIIYFTPHGNFSSYF